MSNTNDSGGGSLRQAILDSNASAAPATVEFDIPASTDPLLDVPVPGFNPLTQMWRITLASPLPAITNMVTIDGYTEAHGGGIPYRYSSLSSAVQSVSLSGTPTGGSFTLTTSAPLPAATTGAIPYNATAVQLQAEFDAILGPGNVVVSGGPAPDTGFVISFQGAYAGQAIPDMVATSNLTGGTNPSVSVGAYDRGGNLQPNGYLTYIQSVPNVLDAKIGNDAKPRVIVDGSQIDRNAYPNPTGFVVDASHSVLRGLIIRSFDVGVSVPQLDMLGNPNTGDWIQGNFIGDYFVYPVNTQTGSPLTGSDAVVLVGGAGNTNQGITIFSSNTTVGGPNPQENNVIIGNGAQGIWLEPGASGNQVVSNQIGLAGPLDNGFYYQDGNGAEGVWIQSSGSLANPSGILYSSSNYVLNNVISANAGDGVHLSGVGANLNLVQGNYIGVAAPGGYLFGTGNPGNGDAGDGVRIEDGFFNKIGGPTSDLGNVISSNHGAGVSITGAPAVLSGGAVVIPATGTGNTVANNMIGVTAAGNQIIGNAAEGVALYSPSNTIGPGNVISQNLLGIGIYGPGAATPGNATQITVVDNFIGTDFKGQKGFGNAREGIRVDNSPANTIQGNATGSQVISGNQVGIALLGASSTQNVVTGNLIGSDVTGLFDLGNKAEGVLIEGATGNTIGGSLAASQNLISANHWGIRLDGAGATANLVQRDYIGTDITGVAPLGNEIVGVIFTNGASNNTIGGSNAGLGNRIGFHVSSGVQVQSGTGNSILSNSIFSNGRLGIDLVAPGDPPNGVTPNQPPGTPGPNDLQSYPVLASVSFDGTVTHIVGTFHSLPSSTFLVQFFDSSQADPTGYGEGEQLLGSTVLTTDASGNAPIDLKLAVVYPQNTVLAATATNQATGDTSEFSASLPESPAFLFSASIYSGTESSGSAVITVTRSRNTGTSSVKYATVAGGTAVAGVDYTATSGTLTFGPGDTSKTFTIPLLNVGAVGGMKTVNLALSNPSAGTMVDFQPTAVLRIIDDSSGSGGAFVVTNTNDAGPGSLRQAILNANATPGLNSILFDIPASTAPLLDSPVPGFDPVNQTWTITLQTPLPAITDPITIDGYTQAEYSIPYRYPDAISSAVQQVDLTGVVTGGFFTLGTQWPLPVGSTAPISATATADQVQVALEGILGTGNVVVTGSAPFYTVNFQGAYARQAVPDLTANPNGLLGLNPGVKVFTSTVGGMAIKDPVGINSIPNSTQAKQGNNAKPRVILDGSLSSGTGFVIDASNSTLRGLIIDGFSVGVSVPQLDILGDLNTGDLIQGNFIGKYFVYPVDPTDGTPTTSPGIALAGLGNSGQGIVIDATNATIGGNNAQEDNVIAGNGSQGIWVQVDATGVVIEGNEIGMIGPSAAGLYVQEGNGAEGILVNGSSTTIGAPGAGNVIAGSGLAGVRISGGAATRTIVAANLIGLAPGGGYRFGTASPGNGGDGVRIENSARNQVGGPDVTWANVISANGGAGVYITGAGATANAVLFNVIGATADGKAIQGNAAEGVAVYSPQNTIGPGNQISGNLRGVLISGAIAAGNLIVGNLIGTDTTGSLDLGNLDEGVLIQDATDNIIRGDAKGSQVISGNLVGVAIAGASATRNLVVGNLIGSDRSGLSALPNAREGILIAGSPGNTIGGNVATAQNLISANHWGIRIDGAGAVGNLVAGDYIGTDISGIAPLGNEVNGVILGTSASGNTIGGITADFGNRIAFNVQAGVSVQSGTGNSILSDAIYANGMLGIDLVAPGDPPSGVTPDQPGVRSGPNDLQNYPVLTTLTSDGTVTHVVGTLNSLPSTTFLLQFFASTSADSSGYGEGERRFHSTQVTTDAAGNAVIDVTLPAPWSFGTLLSATATNLVTGDTSEFSGTIAESSAIRFTAATYAVSEQSGLVAISVSRTLTSGVSTVQYATVAGGTATAGLDYGLTTGTLVFNPGEATKTFTVPILDDQLIENTTETINLALSAPTGGVVDFQPTAVINIQDVDAGSSHMFVVTNTNDAGPGSLRQAILDANAHPGADDIAFDIPASTDPKLNVPVAGFDPVTQTWRIKLQSALPAVTDQVTIDGYTQAHFPIPYRYPSAVSTVMIVQVTGTPTGGSFTLSTQSPLPLLTTSPLAYNASAADVLFELNQIFGVGNVTVSGGPANVNPFKLTFIGRYQGQSLPPLVATNSLTGGVDPAVVVNSQFQLGTPVEISSTPNAIAARDGNNARVRVIVDGSQTIGATGFVLDTTNSSLRGLIIDGFSLGVSVPRPADVGNLIQGDFIGQYFEYPVDPVTGTALQAPNNIILAGLGNAQQGVYLDANNTTVGGTNPQENNVISGNWAQGIFIDIAATGNVIEGNQVGIIGPSDSGLYAQVGNGAEGILVYGSSNAIGGPGVGAGNLISGNNGAGVRIAGQAATRNIVAGNLIGLGPGGGYLFGNGNPGNVGDGVRIEDAPFNQVGGPDTTWTNAISSNAGAGVFITGAGAIGNTIQGNLIGLTADGKAVKGNSAAGVAVFSPQTVVGPGNVISGNLRGVLVSGAAATQAIIRDNLIGTDITGEFHLGNALEGVRIEGATDAVVEGDGKGSQVISGNQQGVVIVGATATRNLVAGNLIGSDKTGLNALPNAQEGVAILGSGGNTIGGSGGSSANLISANHWGVRLDGAGAAGNVVAGNLIGTDITGKAPLGSEVNGVIFSNNASGNTIGGSAAGAGNVIAFNVLAGISVGAGTGNSVLSNRIFSNGRLGIDLVAPGDPPGGVTPNQPGVRTGPNDLQNHPVLVTAVPGPSGGVQGTLNGLPNTQFQIQFFTNSIADPTGYGQGQTPLGSTLVTTDGQGNATFAYSPSGGLAANLWVTATATSVATGDTSEFSNAVSATPVSVQFAASALLVDATAGTELVHVQRIGNGNAIVSVNYATADGTAVAGKDYAAASGTLTFQPGEFDKTFAITILANPAQKASSVTVNMALGQPTGGAALGAISTAVLTINDNLPPIVQFAASTYSGFSTSSSVVVTVTRGGGNRGTTVQVNYATAGGTAAPGVDYTPVSGTLTFQPNQLTARFTVPILPGGGTPGVKTLGLSLSSPGGGAQLGTLSAATLSITTSSVNSNPGPSGPVDTVPPQVIGTQLVLGPGGITGVTFSFSEPLDPTRARDLGNYGYFAISAGPDNQFGTSDDRSIPLAGVQFTAPVTAVTVIPSSPLPLSGFYRIVLDGLSSPLLNRGLADTSGNLLSGRGNGVAGEAFVATFGASNQLAYTDSQGKRVTLSLTGGGLIEMFRAPTGDVQGVSLLGTVPRKSVLTLQANRAGGRTTYMPPIHGSAGVRFRYRSPASMFRWRR